MFFQTYRYLMLGIYHVYIEDWFAVFPRNQFYVMRMEDYNADKKGNIKSILSLLDVGTYVETSCRQT